MTRNKKMGPCRVGFFPLAMAVWAALVVRGSAGASKPDQKPVLGVEALCRLDLLPRLKSSVSIGCVSSYDRSGGNDDGFSGKYSYIRKEAGGLVIADLAGPGVITRIHTPSPTDDIVEFYFDGEARPRLSLKWSALFDGTRPPFLPPMAGAGVGGHWSYVPLAYQKSCKVVVKAETFNFYQINYARYPKNTVIPTYQDPPTADFVRRLEDAGRILRASGSDISPHLVPEGTRIETRACRATLGPGQSVTLFEATNPGRIVGLKLGPAAAFIGKDKDIVINMYWDGDPRPAVSCPAGDFFGYSFGEPAIRSLFLGTAESVNYIHFPMPFERSARIELVSERASGPAIDIGAEVEFAGVGKSGDEGRFYAFWHRENPCRPGLPYTYLKTTGRGHIAGVVLQAQGLETGQTSFFEGDDRAYIDGELAIPGTGSEDSFNGGWYDVPARWEERASFPFGGCLDYKKPLGRTGGFRWFVTDAYSYSKSIEFTIEHGPEGNQVGTDYTSVVYFYSLEPPPRDSSLPAPAARKISDPDRIVFVPGWNVPIHTFSFKETTLAKKVAVLGETKVRHLSMRSSGEDIFGPHSISMIFDLPSAGKYKIGLKALRGPDQAIVRLFRHDSPEGEAANLYAEKQEASPLIPLGVLDMEQGDNVIYFVLTGKDVRSTGLGLDLVEVVFERVK